MDENQKKLIELRTELTFYRKLDKKIDLAINGELSLEDWSNEVSYKLSILNGKLGLSLDLLMDLEN